MTDFIPSLREAVKQLLDRPDYRPMTRHEIAAALRLPPDLRSSLRATLRELQGAGEAVCLRKNRWSRPDAGRHVVGELSVHIRGHGTVTCDDGRQEFRVEARDLRGAVSGDLVAVEPLHLRAGPAPAPARVVRVIERRRERVPGLLKETRFYWYLIPEDPRFGGTVRVTDFADGLRPADHQMAVARLDPWNPHAVQPTGRVEEILGPPDAPGVDMRALMSRFNLTAAFPPDAEAEAAGRTAAHPAADRRERRDLRSLPACTIDPADARDFDDAVSIGRLPGGRWEVHVHIADVAAYVPPGSAIDREARLRGTTVYLVDRALTMLPPHLTADVCSLRPHEDRLCHSVRLVLEPDGRVVEEETFPSVIRSAARLDYDQVQRFIEGRGDSEIPATLRPHIADLHRLARILRERRMREGALDFMVPEVRCIVDADGEVTGIRPRGATEAYQLIEEFMLLANRCVAGVLMRARVPAMYRIHEPPDDDQWARMNEMLFELGAGPVRPDGRELSRLARGAAGTPLAYAVAMAILRNLKRAVYSPTCAVHFGLACRPYTHFTSPIRRYPDLVVHRILRAIEDRAPPPYGHAEIAAVARHSTRMEREADEAERESVEMKRIGYYRRLLDRGETGPFDAVVAHVLPRGLIVEIPATLQRGLVPAELLRPGGRGARRPAGGWRIGSELKVEVIRVDTYRKLVDFRPAAMPDARPAAEPRHGPRARRLARGKRRQRNR